MNLANLDIGIFVVYVVGLLALALYISRAEKNHERNTQDYFLASKSLPWGAIGASLIAANISAEQFIGMSGSGFAVYARQISWRSFCFTTQPHWRCFHRSWDSITVSERSQRAYWTTWWRQRATRSGVLQRKTEVVIAGHRQQEARFLLCSYLRH